MGWVRKYLSIAIVAGIVLALSASWAVMAMENTKSVSNEESEIMLSKNLCDYEITDYEKIKPEILSMFPIGMSEEELRKRLAEFPLTEARGNKVYEMPFPKIEDGQRVIKDGEVVLSNRFFFAMVECGLPYGNKNIWSFEFTTNEQRVISENNFYVSIEDENFSKRGIELKVMYLGGTRNLSRIINSVAKANYHNWSSFRDYLRSVGFDIIITTNSTGGSNNYSIEIEVDTIYARLLGVESWVIKILIDENGKFIRAYR